MPYQIALTRKLWLRAFLIPCAHLCRYCCISSKGEKHNAQFGFTRFHALADRFEAWGKTAGFSVTSTDYASDDITDKVAAFLDETIGPAGTPHDKPVTPGDAKLRSGWVRTGGAKFKSDDGIRDWLARWRDAGSTLVHGSFAGYRESHDWWNNRPGDYDFLMRVQKIAAEMGFQIGQTVFTMKNTLPALDRLVADLDRLTAEPAHRYVLPVAYLGRARNRAAENQRMTEEERDAFRNNGLDLRFNVAYERPEPKSEREWIREMIAAEPEAPSQGLVLDVDDRNIDALESVPCEETVAGLRSRVETAYRELPSRAELMDRYGDPDGKKIYGLRDDVERVWIDRGLRQRGIRLERGLTHLL